MKKKRQSDLQRPLVFTLLALTLAGLSLILWYEPIVENLSWFAPLLLVGVLVVLNSYVVYKLIKAETAIAPWLTILTTFVSITFVVLIAGPIKDLLGIVCTGFFGVRWSCTQESQLTLIYFSLPLLASISGIGALLKKDKSMKLKSKQAKLRLKRKK